MKKPAPDCQDPLLASTKLVRLYNVDGRDWLLDIAQVHPDRFEDIVAELRCLLNNQLHVARLVRAASNWRFELFMVEIQGVLRRLQSMGVLTEVPKEA